MQFELILVLLALVCCRICRRLTLVVGCVCGCSRFTPLARSATTNCRSIVTRCAPTDTTWKNIKNSTSDWSKSDSEQMWWPPVLRRCESRRTSPAVCDVISCAYTRPRLCTLVSCAMFLTIVPFIHSHGSFVSVYIYADVVCLEQDAAFGILGSSTMCIV